MLANIARLSTRVALAITVTAATPLQASAHVKWFASSVDVSRPPIPLAEVITPTFVAGVFAFAIMIFVGSLVDGWAARRWPAFESSGERHAGAEEKLVRLGTGAFFLCLWDTGGTILVPELLTDAGWINLVQFAVAVLVIWRATCILAAVGMLILFSYGIAEYGVFHMADYVSFLGIAAYLALTPTGSPNALRMRVPLLVGCLAFSLMWTAIEKFVYPQWAITVLLEHPKLTLGVDPPLVATIAGFVEFSGAFYLATGRGLLRVGSAVLIIIFSAPVPEFGHLETVGHIPLVAILGLVCLSGASPLQESFRLSGRGLVLNAGAMSLLLLAMLAGWLSMYYGLQWNEFS